MQNKPPMSAPAEGKSRQPTKLTRKERRMIEMLCRLARAVRIILPPEFESLQAFFDAEYDVRLHWRIRR